MATQLTLKVSEQAKQEFLAIHEALKAEEKVFTMSETMETLVREHNNPRTVEVENPETLRKAAEAEDEARRQEERAAEYENRAAELERENGMLKQRISELETANAELSTANEQAGTDMADMEKRLAAAGDTIAGLQLKPFPARLLELTAQKLSERYKRTITPTEILSDMFLKYTIQQYNVWFYPFVLSDKEILETANEINPQITTLQQVKSIIKNKTAIR